MSKFLHFNILPFAVITIFVLFSQVDGISFCSRCKNTLMESYLKEPMQPDPQKLLSTLIDICTEEFNHRRIIELSSPEKCVDLAEILFNMTDYEYLCAVAGLCESEEYNSTQQRRSCSATLCASLGADCTFKCSCEKDIYSPVCLDSLRKVAFHCKKCFSVLSKR